MKISIKNHQSIEGRLNDNLMDLFKNNQLSLEAPCGGKGLCGKCKVKIIKGQTNDITHEEKNILSSDEINNGVRLACLTHPVSDIDVEILNWKETKGNILSYGYMPEFNYNPPLKSVIVKKGDLDFSNNLSIEEILNNKLNIESSISLEVMKNLSEVVCNNDEIEVVLHNNDIIYVGSKSLDNNIYGICVDIGTTTVVASLVNVYTGEEINSLSSINPQKDYGLDVLTRIDHCSKDGGLKTLQSLIINCINDLIKDLCLKNNIDKNRIFEVVISANSTMNHIFLGVNPKTLGKAPYSTVFRHGRLESNNDFNLNINGLGKIYIIPSVSSYIGADIVSGIVVTSLNTRNDKVLFIDIGTNGEIVLSHKDGLLCCSCAAGPALEGMNISCGMRGETGAIEKVKIDNNGVNIEVIGDETIPYGVCGSGIMDIVGELRVNGIINNKGRFKTKDDLTKEGLEKLNHIVVEEPSRGILLHNNESKSIIFTQKDLRQVQLSKGAILSGFYGLLNYVEMPMESLEQVIIAGQFGSHLTKESLINIGLIPEILKDKITYVGNSSKVGAIMALLSKDIRLEMDRIIKDIKYVELSTLDGYDKLFTKCLKF